MLGTGNDISQSSRVRTCPPTTRLVAIFDRKFVLGSLVNTVLRDLFVNMVNRCSAANCTNKREHGFSLHELPKDEPRRTKWIQQIRRTRSGPKGTLWNPPKTVFLCSAHFDEECYELAPSLKQQFGMDVYHKKQLKTTAVPSIFPRARDTVASTAQPAKRRKSAAFEKRRRLEVLEDCQKKYEESSAQTAVEEETRDGAGHSAECDGGVPVDVNPTELDTTSTSCCDSAVQVSLKPATKTKAVQFSRKGRSKAVQTIQTMCLPTTVTVATQTEVDEEDEEDEHMSVTSVSSNEDQMIEDDPDYVPSSGEESDSDDPEEETAQPPQQDQPPQQGRRIFLVFWACLAQLIAKWCSCPSCASRDLQVSYKVVGTFLRVTLKCKQDGCGCHEDWDSQPFFGRTAAGNILLSAAILFSGATATKVLRVLNHMGVAVISVRSFFRHQSQVLFTAVQRVWAEKQVTMLNILRAEKKPLVCGGDGRADTPGHCAKYGTYTLMELRKTIVIDVQLVQSNEVGGSYHLELEGLRRSLEKVEDHVDVGSLVTDRHLGINKMVREDYPHIKHFFDIWHVAKSVKKKLQNLSKLRDCQALKPWVSSIVNHLYWSVVSTPQGIVDVIVDKWRSVYNHTHNIHEGFEGAFPKCAHDPLEGRQQRKPWLPLHTKMSVVMEKIITNNKLCQDIKRLSPDYQTSYLEAFHALILHFAPKMFHFSHRGMQYRVILAAMHFNENANRAHRRRRDGEDMYSLHYPKAKQGGYIVRKVLEKPTFVYARELLDCVEAICSGDNYEGDMLEGLLVAAPVPPPLNATFQKPQKEAAVREKVNRFQH
ncbi:uncharacterized protein [Branchiostoma lanceolatum]|uniref:uncharacterized protein n=1 Tax=Branchiostoma lanceolatum TaxID=7740 RepID=UPI003456026C